MAPTTQNVAVLGSTGSIGVSALDVIAHCPQLKAVGLSAHTRARDVLHQAHEFEPDWVVVTDPQAGESVDWTQLPSTTNVQFGPQALEQLVVHESVDTVLAGIVGVAGLRSTWAAVSAGKRIALANKETLVVAGPLMIEAAQSSRAELLPVDSEHSAVFQAMACGRREDVHRVILTASGGPFREFTAAQMQHVTVEQALDHPTWNMGPKITVDSATMMNKALEIIEARWLFDLDPDQIDVVVHPQSIVHSMVEYRDGSVMAQMSPPDMRLPIQYALTYPERLEGPAAKLDFQEAQSLEFHAADHDRFPALRLGLEVARQGGTAGAVLNAANEAAVNEFLQGQLAFTEIVAACRSVLDAHNFDPHPTLDELFKLDQWAREEISRWVCT